MTDKKWFDLILSIIAAQKAEDFSMYKAKKTAFLEGLTRVRNEYRRQTLEILAEQWAREAGLTFF